MDVLLLSRLQFAITTFFHFLFVPLSLGLAVMIAVMETRYVISGDEAWRRMARFWGRIFLINFVTGVVTGITLEFQFGTNWSRYSSFMGDIFGSLLAIEALGFFFLESTMVGVWAFGWKKLSPKAHAIVAWLVAFGTVGSSLWILTANAWMQHPVGYAIRSGRAELVDFAAVLTNPFAALTILHTVSGAMIVGAFFVMGVSAWHILRGQETDLFTRSLRLALIFAVVFSLFEVAEGHVHGSDLAKTQPAKLAALEAHWETSTRAPIYLVTLPDQQNRRNRIELVPLPGALSLLAKHDPSATVTGLNDFAPDEIPPVMLTHFSFRIMVALGFYFALISAIAFLLRKRIGEFPLLLRILVWSIPLPYIANEAGWTVAEVGRQPWIVYGLMKTADASSPVSAAQVGTSFFFFTAAYSFLGVVAFWLIIRSARSTKAAAGTEVTE